MFKRVLIGCLLGGFLAGCMRVDTDPTAQFHEVGEEMMGLTGLNIYWDTSIQDSFEVASTDQLLEEELTPARAVEIALLNNQNLQGFYENLGIAKGDLAQAGLLKNPIFSFAYRFSTKSNVTDMIDMSLLQNFLEILLIPMKKRVARAELEKEMELLKGKILEVIAKTKSAFYHVEAKKEIWELKKKILLARELSYEGAKRLHLAGNVIELKVSMEKSLYEQAKLEVASAEIDLLNGRERLSLLMGLWGREIDWKVAMKLPPIPREESNYETIENDAVASSIDLSVAYKGLVATAASFGVDTTRLVFPALDVGVSAEREDGIWYVGPAFNLAIPLFDFGKANRAKAKSRILQEWKGYTALAIEVRSKARASRFNLLNAYRQAVYLKRVIVPLSEKITEQTLLQHNAMQIGIFELLSKKREELERKIEEIHTHVDYIDRKIALETLLKGHMLRRDDV